MTITLTPEQRKWIETQVAAGHFASIEEAISIAVTELMLASEPESEAELAELRRLIDQGDADIQAGRVYTYADAEELADDILGSGDARSKQKD
jgi:antitoxin ParD1/3/4